MKEYWILDCLLHEAHVRYLYTFMQTKHLAKQSQRAPIHMLEYDDARLYFTTYDLWEGKYGIGRRDRTPIPGWKFESMLIKWKEEEK